MNEKQCDLVATLREVRRQLTGFVLTDMQMVQSLIDKAESNELKSPASGYKLDFLQELIASGMEEIKTAIKQTERNIMATTQAQLDAVIAALPGQIETALAPVITAIQQAAASNSIDLTNEVNQLQAIPAAIATALTPAPPAPAPAPAAS